MKLADHPSGFEIHMPTSGGKAGKGYEKTGSIQVRWNNAIVKQFRFSYAKGNSAATMKKARVWCDQNTPGTQETRFVH